MSSWKSPASHFNRSWQQPQQKISCLFSPAFHSSGDWMQLTSPHLYVFACIYFQPAFHPSLDSKVAFGTGFSPPLFSHNSLKRKAMLKVCDRSWQKCECKPELPRVSSHHSPILWSLYDWPKVTQWTSTVGQGSEPGSPRPVPSQNNTVSIL